MLGSVKARRGTTSSDYLYAAVPRCRCSRLRCPPPSPHFSGRTFPTKSLRSKDKAIKKKTCFPFRAIIVAKRHYSTTAGICLLLLPMLPPSALGNGPRVTCYTPPSFPCLVRVARRQRSRQSLTVRKAATLAADTHHNDTGRRQGALCENPFTNVSWLISLSCDTNISDISISNTSTPDTSISETSILRNLDPGLFNIALPGGVNATATAATTTAAASTSPSRKTACQVKEPMAHHLHQETATRSAKRNGFHRTPVRSYRSRPTAPRRQTFLRRRRHHRHRCQSAPAASTHAACPR